MQDTGLLKPEVSSDGVHPTVTSLNAACVLRRELIRLPTGTVAELSGAPLPPCKADLPASRLKYKTVTRASKVCCLTWRSDTPLALYQFEMQDGCEKPLCELLCTYGEVLPAQVVQLGKCQAD